ncbi:anoctamin-5 [Astyanax mexicanus]|uniref:anoctamin-5 n=1 Tax=Astyanax mexicanus TaxID=7994 RepID=UPI0020CAC44A|nr:anoctamin-5 [Astyanax mexicanus]
MERRAGEMENATLIEMNSVVNSHGEDRETPHPIHQENKNSVYGEPRIDFVLSYVDDDDGGKKAEQRKLFEDNLRKKYNLQLEHEYKSESPDCKTHFLKIHAPWEVLAHYADKLKIKVPFGKSETKQGKGKECLDCLKRHLYPPSEIIKPERYYTAPFDNSKSDSLLIEDKETFFHPSTRNRIVYYILTRCPYYQGDQVNKNKTGIKRLLSNGTYTSAYPLHDCLCLKKAEQVLCESDRDLLYKHWARFRCFYKKQPLDLIRKYYGEKIGIYFAWLGFYTEMLFFAAVVGVICFAYGLHTYDDNITSKEVCDPDIGGKIVMCPLCDKMCSFWKLNLTCLSSRTIHLFDNAGTVFFAVFMGIWVTLFLEFWKRRQARLKYEWDLVDFNEEEQLLQIRPEFELKCTEKRKNPITEEEEPYLPIKEKCPRLFVSGATVLFWTCLVVACIIGVIAYRLAVYATFAGRIKNMIQLLESVVSPQQTTAVTASLINFAIILILNFLYGHVAIWITDMEIPKTHSEYENSLTTKMFMFQFVNYYSSCFYVAFFKGKFVGYPGEYTYMFGGHLRNEECAPEGCLIELTTQLGIIMSGKQLVANIQEIVLPLLKNWWTNRKRRGHSGSSQWEQDHALKSLSQFGLFDEYLEMVIQFGFITLFVASFPLAPLLALFNNILEVRLDAWKFTTQLQRPVAIRARNIGAWNEILNVVAVLSVITNAFIMAFTSEMIPRLVYLYAYHPGEEATMAGYISNSLSVYEISDLRAKNLSHFDANPTLFSANITKCRYRDYRYPPGHPQEYKHTMQFWHILAARLAFIIIMEHIVFVVKFLVAYLIPDVPSDVRDRIRFEQYLVQNRLVNEELKMIKSS